MLVLWSGGLDSTLVLWQRLNAEQLEPKDEPRKGGEDIGPWKSRHPDTTVRALTVLHPQVPAHERQDEARFMLAKEFAKRGKTFEQLVVRVGNQGSYVDVRRGTGHAQLMIWLMAAMPVLGESEDLYTGWLNHETGDETQTLFDAAQRAQGKTGKLIRPLDGHTKLDVIKEMRRYKLHDLCWWCESNSEHSAMCGNCKPCQTHLGAMAVFATRFPYGREKLLATIDELLKHEGKECGEIGLKEATTECRPKQDPTEDLVQSGPPACVIDGPTKAG